MAVAEYLMVYKCTDTGEEESCFLLPDLHSAAKWLAERHQPPLGFRSRPGYYFYEAHCGARGTSATLSLRSLLRQHQQATDTDDGEMLEVVCAHLEQLFTVDDIIAREFWEHVVASLERAPGAAPGEPD